MDKTYDPQCIEQPWYRQWLTLGLLNSHESNTSPPYCIMLPPPNVTGTLHMGHGFQQTLMDALIRFHKMQGENTLWQGGTDHAGIATQMVVERQLNAQGLSKSDLGREAFIEKVKAWQQSSGNQITHQIQRLGAAIDWRRLRFTMDEGLTQATYTAFIRLYEDELIYRGKRLVNWDTQLKTALSDLEVNQETRAGHLWYIRYPLCQGEGHIVVATTRPETLFGDTAIAINPTDERFRALLGQRVKLPLTDRDIPIIADDHVDPTFGTGCVKVTPAHDFNDFAIGQRHALPMITVLDETGHLNDKVPAAYQGQDRFQARKHIIADLQALGLLEKTEPHTLSLPIGDRSGTVIEPRLTDQWYLKMKPLAEPAMAAVEDGTLRFIPENWTKIYLQWLTQIEDWCISRQLWWGHRIPIWYDPAGQAYPGLSEADVRERYKLGRDLPLTQDPDVLDTWFTSALWPFATLGWPSDTEAFRTYYPTQTLITGFDIIFFWVARMVMMGLYFTGQVPFKTVYIHGLIRDHQGQKMSKSKGNVLDPIDLIDGIELSPLIEKRCRGLMQPDMKSRIEKITRQAFPQGIDAHGTDALRFTFCALANTGRDINFDMGRVAGYRNFCNKLWNAARFVLLNTSTQITSARPMNKTNYPKPSAVDQWLLLTIRQAITEIDTAFDQFRFDRIANVLYDLIWHAYCDWYLEFSKVALQRDAGEQHHASKQGDAAKQHHPDEQHDAADRTRFYLLYTLELLLRLAHPVMPFITEVIWQQIAPHISSTETMSIMQQPYPTPEALDALLGEADPSVIQDTFESVEWIKGLITALRNARGELTISPKQDIEIIIGPVSLQQGTRLERFKDVIKALANLNSLSWNQTDIPSGEGINIDYDQMNCRIPLAGLVDWKAELARLEKAIKKLELQYQLSHKKLNNPQYVEKAPPAVVSQERERLAEAERGLAQLKTQYEHSELLAHK